MPSTQPSSALTKLADAGTNFVGTGPPAGLGPVGEPEPDELEAEADGPAAVEVVPEEPVADEPVPDEPVADEPVPDELGAGGAAVAVDEPETDEPDAESDAAAAVRVG